MHFVRIFSVPTFRVLSMATRSVAATALCLLLGPACALREQLVLVHVPKTAGTSLKHDLLETHSLPVAQSLEHCAPSLRDASPDARLVVVVRRPRAHVLSQFMHCKYFHSGKRDAHSHPAFDRAEDDALGFARWVEHFANHTRRLALQQRRAVEDFACYNPLNMQSRYLTCRGLDHVDPAGRQCQFLKVRHRPRGYDCFPRAHRCFGPDDCVPSWPHVLAGLHEVPIVGVTEHYFETVCLVVLRMTGSLPAGCDCASRANSTAPAAARESAAEPEGRLHRIRHGLPERHERDVPAGTWRVVDQITRVDSRLYAVALQRFLDDVRAAEEQTGVRLMCAPTA